MRDKHLTSKQLKLVIRYHEGLLYNAKLLGATDSATLEEFTIKYLEKLQTTGIIKGE